jgi:hypothetical protein
MRYKLRADLDKDTMAVMDPEDISKDIFRINTITDNFNNFKLIRYFLIVAIVISLTLVSLGARMRLSEVSDKVQDNEF